VSIDVVILGAGFAGCATAWALARRGIEAVVLEREAELGRYASGRGAGLGRQLCEDDDTSKLAMRGAALTRAHFPQAWKQTGGILCFDTTPHAMEYVARAQRLSLAHAVIDRAQVLAHWPQLTDLPIASAIHVPTDGVIDAMTLLRALADGRRVELSTYATKLVPKGDVVEVRVESRAIATKVLEARVVVDATGAWAGAITGDPPLDSYKRHLFVLEAAPTSAPYVWHVGDRELYIRTDGTSLLVSPCDGDVTTAQDQQPSSNADARLRARLLVAPQLVTAPILKRWACQRAFTPDRKMRLGRDPQRPWLVWAAGLGGHGATSAPAVGEVVADAVVRALS
jgi:glycine/D-amino acid oxidase-like deaminating enzyme